MSSGFKRTLIAVTVSGLMASSAAYATNGYFAHGYSTKEKGLAGAGVAHSQDALASANNPAGLVNVGERLDIGAALFNPNRQYTASTATGGAGTFPLAPGTYESEHTLFFIPHFGYTMKLDDTSVFGLAAYGNGGMNSDYENVPGPGTFGGGAAGVNLAQLFINATYAKKIDADNSVGASLIFAYQQFKADGLVAFGAAGMSNDATKLTDKGDDTSTGFGARIGWQGKVAPEVTLGASYQTKMAMSEFDDYAGLFAEQGDFDIPATLSMGAAWAIDDKSTLVVDVQQIYYSDVASIGNGIQGLLSATGCGNGAGDTSFCLGGSQGAGFGWDDMTVVKIGYEWEMNDMTMRVGISSTDGPITGGANGTPGNPSDSQVMFNILAPGVVETHLTFGLTMPLGSNAEFSFAAMYAPSTDVTGSTQFDPTQTVKLEMDQFEVQGTYTMKF